VSENNCHVFLGSRDLQRGETAIQDIISSFPDKRAYCEVVECDVASDASVHDAANYIKKRLNGEPLFGLVNNAGIGMSDDTESIFNVNFYGPKRVIDQFLPLLDKNSRIVNVGSGSGPSYVKTCSTAAPEVETALRSWDTTFESLENILARYMDGELPQGAYGLSKAALTVYTMQCSRTIEPKISCVSPGFILTKITKDMGATKPPEEGTVSIRHCLFEPLEGNGFYYGSDAKRSPLHYMRNPGEEAYRGE